MVTLLEILTLTLAKMDAFQGYKFAILKKPILYRGKIYAYY